MKWGTTMTWNPFKRKVLEAPKQEDVVTREMVVKLIRKLSQLMLSQGDFVRVATPDEERYFAIPYVNIFPGSLPRFEYEEMGVSGVVRIWLRPTDFQIQTENGIQTVPFYDERCALIWELVKIYTKHFPFVPADNHFLFNGEAIG